MRTIVNLTIGLLLSLVACSSSSPTSAPGSTKSQVTTSKANPCATPGATYQVHFVEQPNGTCGTLSDQIININPDGTINVSFSCEKVVASGCTVQGTNCVGEADGVSCTGTSDSTFASDGSSASGVETLSCSDSTSGCTSTYQVTFTRQ